MEAWAETARLGDVAVYHCGPAFSLLTERRDARLAGLRRTAQSLYARKLVFPAQQVMPGTQPRQYEYLLVRISFATWRSLA